MLKPIAILRLTLAAGLLLFGFVPEASAASPVRGLRAITVPAPGGAILSFRPRGTTVVELRGTERMPNASVTLKVESRPGFVEIDINRGDIKGLEPASRFGRDFLTYVLWVVSVDGAATNVGEITFEAGAPISINVTTTYQTFWMMVTAEPDFAVKDPSSVVVLVSQSQDKTVTTNKAHPVPGALLYYTNYGEYAARPAAPAPARVPSELLQARKAVELASSSGILARPTPAGEEPLPDELRTRDTLQLAQDFLARAEDAFRHDGASADAIQYSRTAAQIAENARALALGAVGGIYVRQLERDLERARAQYDACSKELARLRERLGKLEVELEQERRHTRELESQLLALQERIRSLEEQLEAARRDLAAARDENARLAAERDKICAELRRQLASLGQLQEQGGQMVLTLASDILFDFDRYDLRPVARENLARLAVIRLLLFPGATVRYEGHTDLVGEEDYNQWLSEQRALSVYRYFLEDALARTSDEDTRTGLQEQLNRAEQLLKMTYAQTRRQPEQRQALLAPVSDVVVGKGMREPVVAEKGPNEKNRRVMLLFPPVRAGEATSLCPAAPSPE
ncbi:MAG TPA: OmpA family protein [Candidatus Xenobia bacterium]|nr:OmpA family protein [Candidatus Xenobia bacterium]